jgi:hypothetical protein
MQNLKGEMLIKIRVDADAFIFPKDDRYNACWKIYLGAVVTISALGIENIAQHSSLKYNYMNTILNTVSSVSRLIKDEFHETPNI